jgi:hypothetical protein
MRNQMTNIDYLGFMRRAEISIAEFINAVSDLQYAAEEFGREAEEVVRDLGTMSIVHGHNITRDVAISELSDSEGVQRIAPGEYAEPLAAVLVDELGHEMLFLEES